MERLTRIRRFSGVAVSVVMFASLLGAWTEAEGQSDSRREGRASRGSSSASRAPSVRAESRPSAAVRTESRAARSEAISAVRSARSSSPVIRSPRVETPRSVTPPRSTPRVTVTPSPTRATTVTPPSSPPTRTPTVTPRAESVRPRVEQSQLSRDNREQLIQSLRERRGEATAERVPSRVEPVAPADASSPASSLPAEVTPGRSSRLDSVAGESLRARLEEMRAERRGQTDSSRSIETPASTPASSPIAAPASLTGDAEVAAPVPASTATPELTPRQSRAEALRPRLESIRETRSDRRSTVDSLREQRVAAESEPSRGEARRADVLDRLSKRPPADPTPAEGFRGGGRDDDRRHGGDRHDDHHYDKHGKHDKHDHDDHHHSHFSFGLYFGFGSYYHYAPPFYYRPYYCPPYLYEGYFVTYHEPFVRVHRPYTSVYASVVYDDHHHLSFSTGYYRPYVVLSYPAHVTHYHVYETYSAAPVYSTPSCVVGYRAGTTIRYCQTHHHLGAIPTDCVFYVPPRVTSGWSLLESRESNEAASVFLRDMSQASKDPVLDVGYSLSLASSGDDLGATSAMRAALRQDALVLDQTPVSGALREIITEHERRYVDRGLNGPAKSDAWFMAAAMQYLRGDLPSARESAAKAYYYGDRDASIDNLAAAIDAHLNKPDPRDY